MALRRAHLEISHQLETSHEEIRGLSLRLQENVSGDGKVELYKTQNSLVGAIKHDTFLTPENPKLKIKYYENLLKIHLKKKTRSAATSSESICVVKTSLISL